MDAVMEDPSIEKTHMMSEGADGDDAVAKADEKDKDSQLLYGAVESQWILTCLEDAYDKLSLSSYLTPKILQDKIIGAIDQDMLLALKEHFEVEKQYTEATIKMASGLDEVEAADEETKLKELDICLSDSTKTVARLLKMNPLLVRRLRDICDKRDASALQFMIIFARLKKLILNKLKMSAEEEQAMKEQLEKLQEEEEGDTKKFLELTDSLARERTTHKEKLKEKENKESRLQKQIEQLSLKTEQERKNFEEKMKSEAVSSEEAYTNTHEQLEKDLAKVSQQLEKDGSEHWTAELKMHRQKFNRAKEVEELIGKYDGDMIGKWKEYSELKKIYKEETAELDVLQEYFFEVDTELKRQEDEIKELTRKRDVELFEQRKVHQAAIILQKLFRGFHIRNGAAQAKAKKTAASAGKEKK